MLQITPQIQDFIVASGKRITIVALTIVVVFIAMYALFFSCVFKRFCATSPVMQYVQPDETQAKLDMLRSLAGTSTMSGTEKIKLLKELGGTSSKTTMSEAEKLEVLESLRNK